VLRYLHWVAQQRHTKHDTPYIQHISRKRQLADFGNVLALQDLVEGKVHGFDDDMLLFLMSYLPDQHQLQHARVRVAAVVQPQKT
jgi:hypothetical protein